MINLAVVGGGPGGLMAAWNLKKKLRDLCKVTIFEAGDRLGGKVLTQRFESEPAMYEAGVAEIYDYSMIGPDPLRELIQDHFGFQTIPMDSETVVMDGEVIEGAAGMGRQYGPATARAIELFREKCAAQISPAQYYEGVGGQDNEHPWAAIDAETLLDREVADPVAKRFFKTMARSDIATESHNTNGLNALKNFVMDIDGYIGVYSIQNGNEQLIDALRSEIDADIQLNHRVLKVGKAENGRYRLNMMNGKGPETHEFDLVLMCLPHNWLATVQWEGEQLRQAMTKHVAYFDRPAHYLRVSILFDEPFWGDKLPGAWFMSESFGGCCVYVEGARHNVGRRGVLNWLIPGSDALAFANLSDGELITQALKSVPKTLGDARAHFMEGKVHRWLSSVNAIPGGAPMRDVLTNHRPEPKSHSGLIVVGDYLFDSTLNGLLDSSDVATDLIVSEVTRMHYAGEGKGPERAINRDYFDRYRGVGPYAQVWREFTDPDWLADVLQLAWNPKPGYRVLIAGSADGSLVGALREKGIDAWGIENNKYIHGQTPKHLRKYNKLGTASDLPFRDRHFDLVVESCLCHMSERQIEKAMAEFRRVAKRGVMFGSVTSDLPASFAQRYDMLHGIKKLATWWEWSELFFDNGYDVSRDINASLPAIWQRTLDAGKGGADQWYDSPESLRYSFFDIVEQRD